MDSIGVRELRQNASVYLERVKKGESIEVTERGVPVAILSPAPSKTMTLLEQMIADGRATAANSDFREWLDEPLPAVEPGEPTLTETILAMREQERY
jgi:prevent-host-death family protein